MLSPQFPRSPRSARMVSTPSQQHKELSSLYVAPPSRRRNTESLGSGGALSPVSVGGVSFPVLVSRRSSEADWTSKEQSESVTPAHAPLSPRSPTSLSPRRVSYSSAGFQLKCALPDANGLDYDSSTSDRDIFNQVERRKKTLPNVEHFLCCNCKHWRLSADYVKAPSGRNYCSRGCETEALEEKMSKMSHKDTSSSEQPMRKRSASMDTLLDFLNNTEEGKALCRRIGMLQLSAPKHTTAKAPMNSFDGMKQTVALERVKASEVAMPSKDGGSEKSPTPPSPLDESDLLGLPNAVEHGPPSEPSMGSVLGDSPVMFVRRLSQGPDCSIGTPLDSRKASTMPEYLKNARGDTCSTLDGSTTSTIQSMSRTDSGISSSDVDCYSRTLPNRHAPLPPVPQKVRAFSHQNTLQCSTDVRSFPDKPSLRSVKSEWNTHTLNFHYPRNGMPAATLPDCTPIPEQCESSTGSSDEETLTKSARMYARRIDSLGLEGSTV